MKKVFPSNRPSLFVRYAMKIYNFARYIRYQ
jgi:hypothetical protein